MKIRRYMAKNTQEAILKVKMDLGSEALILNTRKVRKKGLLGLFSKPMTEVLAAVDEYNTPGKENENAGKGTAVSNNAVILDKKEEKIANLENKISDIEEMLQKLCTRVMNGEKPADRMAGDELKNRKTSVAEVFYNNLVNNEVDPEIARKLVNAAAARMTASDGVNEMAAQLSGIIAGLLGSPETIREKNNGKPVTVIFVGPTGVGKTTTLAKIAANYLLNKRKQVSLITADTYRIAAVEQLKTAPRCGIPVTVVYRRLRWKAVASIQGIDTIDTGRE